MSWFLALGILIFATIGLADRSAIVGGNETVDHMRPQVEVVGMEEGLRGIRAVGSQPKPPSSNHRERFVAAHGRSDRLAPEMQRGIPTSLIQNYAEASRDQCCQIKKAVLKDVQTQKKIDYDVEEHDFSERPLICYQEEGATCKKADKQPVLVNLVWVEFSEDDTPKIGSTEYKGGYLDGFSTDILDIEGAAGCLGTTPHCNSIDTWDNFLSDFNKRAAETLGKDAPVFKANPKAEAPLVAISMADSFKITGGLFEHKFTSAVGFVGQMNKDVEHNPPEPPE